MRRCPAACRVPPPLARPRAASGRAPLPGRVPLAVGRPVPGCCRVPLPGRVPRAAAVCPAACRVRRGRRRRAAAARPWLPPLPPSCAPGLRRHGGRLLPAADVAGCASVHSAGRLGAYSLLDLVVFDWQAAVTKGELAKPNSPGVELPAAAGEATLARLDQIRNGKLLF